MVFDHWQPATRFTVDVRERTSGVVTVGISGDLDRETHAEAEQVITELLRTERPRCVALDMSQVTFIGSDGVSMLLTCRQAAEQVDSRLEITGAHDQVRRVLTMVALDELLNLPADGRRSPAPRR